MSKPTSVKLALKKLQDKTKEDPAEATEVNLQFQWPPIEKMDINLSSLVNCQ